MIPKIPARTAGKVPATLSAEPRAIDKNPLVRGGPVQSCIPKLRVDLAPGPERGGVADQPRRSRHPAALEYFSGSRVTHALRPLLRTQPRSASVYVQRERANSPSGAGVIISG